MRTGLKWKLIVEIGSLRQRKGLFIFHEKWILIETITFFLCLSPLSN